MWNVCQTFDITTVFVHTQDHLLAVMSSMTNSRTFSTTTQWTSKTTSSAFENILSDMFGTSPRERASVVTAKEVERWRHCWCVSRAYHRHQDILTDYFSLGVSSEWLSSLKQQQSSGISAATNSWHKWRVTVGIPAIKQECVIRLRNYCQLVYSTYLAANKGFKCERIAGLWQNNFRIASAFVCLSSSKVFESPRI